MLKFLHIENIAVIEQSDIDFTSGFNVLTGETGAGKSIIIDAINAVLGERTSKDLIRGGCTSAQVSAVFGELNDFTLNYLKEFGITPDEDGNILISRKLSLSGKGLIKINNIPITATTLKEISKSLINIHGQHDNQSLLDPEKHWQFVDAVADNNEALSEYYNEFKNINSIRKELSSLETDYYEKQRLTDLLKYQINELESANIKPGEVSDLKNKLEIANSLAKTNSALEFAKNALLGSDENDGALTLVSSALKQVISLNTDNFSNLSNYLSESLSSLQDAESEIASFLNNDEYYGLNPDEINSRLDCLYKLMVKYGSTEEEMLLFLENAKKKLEDISVSDQRIAVLDEQLEVSKQRLIELSEKLTITRVNAARIFEKKVCDILQYLNMPNVRFYVDIKKGKYTKNGSDVIEFLISANAGEDLKPLHKIASGGELSRVMLAIKSVLLDKDTVGTMIFDEIDTGISGYTAGKVGIQLKKVSSNRQVICVTHLAQIAALAHTHLLINKNTNEGRTFTEVLPLEYEQRIGEIARIMSGSDLTENLYNSAKELLDRSNFNDNL